MTTVHVLSVFTDPKGDFGDAATIILDEGRHIPDSARQGLARQLNTGETAFVNDVKNASISIMHPQGEIDFAGVAALGTAWFLSKLRGEPIAAMEGRGGSIIVTHDGDLTWVRASLDTMPPWNYKRLETAADVEEIKIEDTSEWEHTMVWAWVDEASGLIRARTFATDWEIPEAQGNGSGSLVLAAELNRRIQINHGEGAEIFAKPATGVTADIGGRVAERAPLSI